MRIDGSVANNAVIIGPVGATGSSPYKLYVGGNSYFGGTTTASGTKTFDIPHPTKENLRLRHRCIESPEARLLYEFQLPCNNGTNSIDLPDYFVPLNTACRVYCSSFQHFGAAWGEVLGEKLIVTANEPGLYNILLLGTRNDRAARDEFAKYGTEYDPLVVNAGAD
jgi:hypothetical protein